MRSKILIYIVLLLFVSENVYANMEIPEQMQGKLPLFGNQLNKKPPQPPNNQQTVRKKMQEYVKAVLQGDRKRQQDLIQLSQQEQNANDVSTFLIPYLKKYTHKGNHFFVRCSVLEMLNAVALIKENFAKEVFPIIKDISEDKDELFFYFITTTKIGYLCDLSCKYTSLSKDIFPVLKSYLSSEEIVGKRIQLAYINIIEKTNKKEDVFTHLCVCLNSINRQVKINAIKVLIQIVRNEEEMAKTLIPKLIAILDMRKQKVLKKAMWGLLSLAMINDTMQELIRSQVLAQLISDDISHKSAIILTIGILCEKDILLCKTAKSLLLGELRRRDVRQQVLIINTLGIIGNKEPSVAAGITVALIPFTEHTNESMRVAAINALGRVILSNNDSVVSLILSALSSQLYDQLINVRKSTMKVLSDVACKRPDLQDQIISILLKCIADSDIAIRMYALELFYNIIEHVSKNNQKILNKMLVVGARYEKKRNRYKIMEYVRDVAIKLSHLQEKNIGILLEDLQNEDAGIRVFAVIQLGTIAVKAKNVRAIIIAKFVPLLNDSNERVRFVIWKTLKALGQENTSWIITLVELLEKGSVQERRDAVEKLGDIAIEIKSYRAKLVSIFIAMMGYEKDIVVKKELIKVLKNIAKKDKLYKETIVKEYIKRLDQEKTVFRIEVFTALQLLCDVACNRHIVQACIPFMKSKESKERLSIHHLLSEIVKRDSDNIAFLSNTMELLLREDDSAQKVITISVLGCIGRYYQEYRDKVTELLQPFIENEVDKITQAALYALSNTIHDDNEQAIKIMYFLMAKYSSFSAENRFATIEALGDIFLVHESSYATIVPFFLEVAYGDTHAIQKIATRLLMKKAEEIVGVIKTCIKNNGTKKSLNHQQYWMGVNIILNAIIDTSVENQNKVCKELFGQKLLDDINELVKNELSIDLMPNENDDRLKEWNKRAIRFTCLVLVAHELQRNNKAYSYEEAWIIVKKKIQTIKEMQPIVLYKSQIDTVDTPIFYFINQSFRSVDTLRKKDKVFRPISSDKTHVKTIRDSFLHLVSSSHGELIIHVDAHGGPNHIWLAFGEFGAEYSDNMDHEHGVSYQQLAKALYQRGDLAKVTILLDSCYGYDFLVKTMNYLALLYVQDVQKKVVAAKDIESKRSILRTSISFFNGLSVANKNATAFGNTFREAMKDFAKTRQETQFLQNYTFLEILLLEKYCYQRTDMLGNSYSQDIAVFKGRSITTSELLVAYYKSLIRELDKLPPDVLQPYVPVDEVQ